MFLFHGLDNKKKISAPALVLALLFSALTGSLLVVNLAAADPMYTIPPPDITVSSPVSERTYNVSAIPLSFTIPDLSGWGSFKVLQVQYSLDGGLRSVDGYVLSDPFSLALPTLAEGAHSLRVQAKVSLVPSSNHAMPPNWDRAFSSEVHFVVDTKVPSVSFLSAQGVVYDGAEFSFNFTVSEWAAWLGYSLDGKEVVTVTDKVSSTEVFGTHNYRLALRGLSAGAHGLTVYAEDLGGNRVWSEPFLFTLAQEMTSDTDQISTPFPIAWTAIAVIASAAIICFGLVAYHLKRKSKRSGQT
jgi:hypothetical protein